MAILITAIAVFLLQWIYIGYRFSFGPCKKLGHDRIDRLPGNAPRYHMNKVEPLKDSFLKDKKILFLGSSVTNGYASLVQSIPEYFEARFGCHCTKEAVNGTTLVDNGAKSYVQRLHNCVEPMTHYDLLICQLSTNDASRKMPLGAVSGSRDLDDFDTRTITGAMEHIICYAKNTWDCEVVFYTGTRYDSSAYEEMVNRVHVLSSKWGITVIDLWSNDDFNCLSQEKRKLYMNDPIHPTCAGYCHWWCPEIERQLKDSFTHNTNR